MPFYHRLGDIPRKLTCSSGRTEASIGKKGTDEYAVMFDTFRPLRVAKGLTDFEDDSCQRSWIAVEP